MSRPPWPGVQLADIEADALAGAIRQGAAQLQQQRASHTPTSWRKVLQHRAFQAQAAINAGVVERRARAMTLHEAPFLAQGLAALAMRPGGLRVCGLVFCMTHYPFGTSGRIRYACVRCDPDAWRPLQWGVDLRDVTTIDGGL